MDNESEPDRAANHDDPRGSAWFGFWWSVVLLCGVNAVFIAIVIGGSLHQRLLAVGPVGSIPADVAEDYLWSALFTILQLSAFMVGVSFFVLIAMPFIRIFMRSGKVRHRLLMGLWVVFFSCLLWPISCIGAVKYDYSARTEAFRATTIRARPIIAALEQYKSDTGVYPSALEALTPRYLTEIPHTNLAAYPKFEYAAAPNLDALPTAYELYIRTPFGGINWDVFVYWPEGDYPEYMHGGSVERIDDWAYVHE